MVRYIDITFSIGSEEQFLVDNINKMDHILRKDEPEIQRVMEHIKVQDKQLGDLDKLQEDWKTLMKKTHEELCDMDKGTGDLLIVEAKMIRHFNDVENKIKAFLNTENLRDSGLQAQLNKMKSYFHDAQKQSGGLTVQARELARFDGVHESAWVRAHLALGSPQDVIISIQQVVTEANGFFEQLDKEVNLVLHTFLQMHEQNIDHAHPASQKYINKLFEELNKNLHHVLEKLFEAESYKLILMFKLLHQHFTEEQDILKSLGLPEDSFSELIKERQKKFNHDVHNERRLASMMNRISIMFRRAG